MTRDERRVARGDWQTPETLAREIVAGLTRSGALPSPAAVLEPTCGEGAFLVAAAEAFPEAQLIGFDASRAYVAEAKRRLPSARTRVAVADFFDTRWERVLARLPRPLL